MGARQQCNPTDGDAAGTRDEDKPVNEPLERMQVKCSATTRTAVINAGFFDTAEGIDLPGADLSHEELTVALIPEQVDEFTCAPRFLVGPAPSSPAGPAG